MNNILCDQKKFTIIIFKNDTFLYFAVNQEKHVKKFVDSNSLTEKKNRKLLKSVGNIPSVMYGSCKVHKTSAENCLPFLLILSALNTPTYKLVKLLVPILKPLTTNKFTVKN